MSIRKQNRNRRKQRLWINFGTFVTYLPSNCTVIQWEEPS